MIESPARVKRLDGDTAWVVSEAPTSCGACAGKGCGSSVFARFWHADEAEYPVANPIGAAPGDAVVVGLPDGSLLHAAIAGYGFPLIMLLAGAALGATIFGEPGAVFGGLFALILSLIWLKLATRFGFWPHPAARPAPVLLRLGEAGHCQRS
jgi:sigma-E factor negative regulatory protein RseC